MRSYVKKLLGLFVMCFVCGQNAVNAKVFERCELARLLKDRHRLPLDEVASLVCIAQYQSRFNSSLITGTEVTGAHGLFQISDMFWCSVSSGSAKACGVSCDRLRNDDLSDDLACVDIIREEHQRISGDGYNAWNSYPAFCKGRTKKIIEGCFDGTPKRAIDKFETTINSIGNFEDKRKAKVYDRCELAKDLRYKYKIPLKQIATWICIAKHQSNFNTSALTGPNSEGGGNHGLFQISDIYWCSPPGKGWVCGLSCSKLEDSDISDDVECMDRIYTEHQALSGDGFNAWPSYKPHCKGRSESYIQGCFNDVDNIEIQTVGLDESDFVERRPEPSIAVQTVQRKTGKIYTPCELASDLLTKYKVPREQIATWVCIAKIQSNLNTSAIGRSVSGSSADHGLFQINDIYWCSPPGIGFGCGIACSQLEDSDIRDDVECIRTIYEEHQRLSGNGFNAWAAYSSCKGRAESYIEGCFNDFLDNTISTRTIPTESYSYTPLSVSLSPAGKIYKPCELALELRDKHKIPQEQIATWICIVKHESNFNTSAIGRLNADGSEDHGLFQISDIYWCSPPGAGCRLSCNQLEDSDITDDVECMKQIYQEHQRISGDGFTAWTTYRPYCEKRVDSYIQGCFSEIEDNTISTTPFPYTYRPPTTPFRRSGKVFKPCELAHELVHKHNIAQDQVATWICIVKHESNFNTSAIGRLNADGSEDHGMFQISDIYWCSPPGAGCGLSCNDLEDSDITDDVECIKTIYAEHQRLSGNGFTAWTTYRPYCEGRADSYIQGCFSDCQDNAITQTIEPIRHEIQTVSTANRGKVYSPCELATELRHKHNIPVAQIATWVCIAKHESNFNTSAIGRLNADGSEDHGLFQISDIYWCSQPGAGCRLSCNDLEDSDITDDVECMKQIYAEHQRISGDGFTAWTVYKRDCEGRAERFIQGCFSDVGENELIPTTQLPTQRKRPSKIYSRCELAEELRHKHRMPEQEIATWVCIAEHESNLNTGAVNHGSGDHGLFQISHLYWCSASGSDHKECGLPCSKLEDDDITDDVQCIKKIFKEHARLSGDGFNAWVVYPLYCKDRASSYIESCSKPTTGKPSTTPRPPLIIPAVTAPNDLLSYREQFTNLPNAGKSTIYSYKFSGTTSAPAPAAVTPNLISLGEFVSTTTHLRPGIQQPTILPLNIQTTKSSSVFSPTFGSTAGSRFNLSPTTPNYRGQFSTILYPLSSTTVRPAQQPSRTSFNFFDLYTKAGPIISPKPRFTTTTKIPKSTSQPSFTTAESYKKYFAGFTAFGPSNFSPTSNLFDTTTVRPAVSPSRTSFNIFDTITGRIPTITPTPRLTTRATTLKPSTKRFSTTSHQNRFGAFSTFGATNLFTTTTTTPKPNRFVSFSTFADLNRFTPTPKYSTFRATAPTRATLQPINRGSYRFGSATHSTFDFGSISSFGRLSTTSTTKPPRTRPTQTSQKPIPSQAPRTPSKNIFDFYFDLYKLQRSPTDQKTTKQSFYDSPISTTVQSRPYYQSSTLTDTTSTFRGFRFGSDYTVRPEASAVVTNRKPFEHSTTFTTKPPFKFETGEFFTTKKPLTLDSSLFFTTKRPFIFEDTTISTTRRPFTFDNPAFFTTKKPFRFEETTTSVTSRPFQFDNSAAFFTTRTPFRFEDTTISSTRRPFRFEETTIHQKGSPTRTLFEEFFDRFVH